MNGMEINLNYLMPDGMHVGAPRGQLMLYCGASRASFQKVRTIWPMRRLVDARIDPSACAVGLHGCTPWSTSWCRLMV